MKLNQDLDDPEGRVDVTHVIPYMHPSAGGPPTVVDRMCRHLACRGWTNRVLTTDTLAKGLPLDWADQYGPQCHMTVFSSRGPAPFGYSPQLGVAIDRIVATSRIVHVHTLWTYASWAAIHACHRQGSPFVVMPHGMLDPHSLDRKWIKKQLYGRFVEWPQIRSAAAMIYTHKEEQRLAEDSVRGLPAGFIVPLGADTPLPQSRGQLAEAFFQRFPQTRGKRLVLFFSRLHAKKGLDLLIPAFRTVAVRYGNAHLALVGPGEGDYVALLRRQIDEEGIAAHVTLTGPMLGQAKWEALAAATVLVLPSYQENFAISVAEGMRIGLPVVLTRRVNIWSDVVEAGAGLACELTADSVAEAVSRYLADPTLAQQAGREGQRLATERFHWDRTAEAAEAAYFQVLHCRALTPCKTCATPNSTPFP